MTNKHLALQIRNRLQRYGIQADPDALFDVLCEAITENVVDEKPTLRDQFAMAALTGYVAQGSDAGTYSEKHHGTVENFRRVCALDDSEYCYLLADAMLEARTKQPE